MPLRAPSRVRRDKCTFLDSSRSNYVMLLGVPAHGVAATGCHQQHQHVWEAVTIVVGSAADLWRTTVEERPRTHDTRRELGFTGAKDMPTITNTSPSMPSHMPVVMLFAMRALPHPPPRPPAVSVD